MGKETGADGQRIKAAGNALPDATGREYYGGVEMSEEDIKKFYETIARIISEREQVKVTVQVSRKGAAA